MAGCFCGVGAALLSRVKKSCGKVMSTFRLANEKASPAKWLGGLFARVIEALRVAALRPHEVVSVCDAEAFCCFQTDRLRSIRGGAYLPRYVRKASHDDALPRFSSRLFRDQALADEPPDLSAPLAWRAELIERSQRRWRQATGDVTLAALLDAFLGLLHGWASWVWITLIARGIINDLYDGGKRLGSSPDFLIFTSCSEAVL
jgi:hypothetical protein